jgi:hypothetical protein
MSDKSISLYKGGGRKGSRTHVATSRARGNSARNRTYGLKRKLTRSSLKRVQRLVGKGYRTLRVQSSRYK